MTGIIKLRVEGEPGEVMELCARLSAIAVVIEESSDYPNRPPSRLVRRYVTLSLRLPDDDSDA